MSVSQRHRTAALVALCAGAGLVVGLAAGGLFGEEDGVGEVPHLRGELEAANDQVRSLEQEVERLERQLKPMSAITPTPTQTPTPLQLPAEDTDWDPCERAGLCEFVAQIDRALQARDTHSILELVQWNFIDCHNDPLSGGWEVTECSEWPFDELLPTASLGLYASEGAPASPWRIRQRLDEMVFGLAGASCNEQPVEARVRAVVLPPDPAFPWAGEIGITVGAPFDCLLETLPRHSVYHLALRVSGSEWRIHSFVAGFVLNDEQRYVYKIRYYPIGLR